MIPKIIAALIGLLASLVTGKPVAEGGATGAGGALNSGLFYTGVVGFGAWLISPAGRNFEITFHGWEIWAVVLASAIAGAWLLHLQPPRPPGQ